VNPHLISPKVSSLGSGTESTVVHAEPTSVGRSVGVKRALTGAQLWSTAVYHGNFQRSEKPCSYSTCSEYLWSGRRESNPRSQLGKLMFCR
jgi:hypothetical protein